MQIDIYQKVTDQIIAMLEQGVVPWRSPILGRQSAGLPKNLESGKDYRGINSFLLAFTAWAHGYESYYWLTFNQAKQKKGSVKKGEKSSLVIFWKQYEVTDEETGEPKNVPVLRYYNVFNVTQCEGIAVPDAATFTPIDFKPIDAADAIVKAYADAPVIEHGGTRPRRGNWKQADEMTNRSVKLRPDEGGQLAGRVDLEELRRLVLALQQAHVLVRWRQTLFRCCLRRGLSGNPLWENSMSGRERVVYRG